MSNYVACSIDISMQFISMQLRTTCHKSRIWCLNQVYISKDKLVLLEDDELSPGDLAIEPVVVVVGDVKVVVGHVLLEGPDALGHVEVLLHLDHRVVVSLVAY